MPTKLVCKCSLNVSAHTSTRLHFILPAVENMTKTHDGADNQIGQETSREVQDDGRVCSSMDTSDMSGALLDDEAGEF